MRASGVTACLVSRALKLLLLRLLRSILLLLGRLEEGCDQLGVVCQRGMLTSLAILGTVAFCS